MSQVTDMLALWSIPKYANNQTCLAHPRIHESINSTSQPTPLSHMQKNCTICAEPMLKCRKAYSIRKKSPCNQRLRSATLLLSLPYLLRLIYRGRGFHVDSLQLCLSYLHRTCIFAWCRHWALAQLSRAWGKIFCWRENWCSRD